MLVPLETVAQDTLITYEGSIRYLFRYILFRNARQFIIESLILLFDLLLVIVIVKILL